MESRTLFLKSMVFMEPIEPMQMKPLHLDLKHAQVFIIQADDC